MAELELLDKNFLSSLSVGQSIESLISAPLTAVSKANAMMLSGQAQFILDYCFRKNGEVYSPVMIKMEYSQGNDKCYFYLPLLTLIPLNNLAVDKVNVKFNIEVTSTVSHVSNYDGSNGEVKSKVIQKKAKLGAKIGASNADKESSGGISVDIKAKQIPLTKGLTSIIDMYSKSMITSKE